jgi:hypothetical protein
MHRFRTDTGNPGSELTLAAGLAQVEVRTGEIASVELDATVFQPGSLAGRAILDGQVFREGRVFLRESNGVDFGQFMSDSDGRFVAQGLLPGRYRVGLLLGTGRPSNGGAMLSADSVTISSGQEHSGTFHIEHRVMRIRLLEADGVTPMARTGVRVTADEIGSISRTTDGDGWMTVDPAPAGPVRFHIQVTGAVGHTLGPIEMPAGKKEASFELRVGGE